MARYKLDLVGVQEVRWDIEGLIKSRGLQFFIWTLGRPRRRWEDNIKMDIQEVGCRGMDWIELAQDRDR